jgi:Raf kinase inhibitor-like YbhB/YbcL family protein
MVSKMQLALMRAALTVIAAVFAACGGHAGPAVADGARNHGTTLAQGGETMSLALTSPAFDHKGDIPVRYTCDGMDVSPPLAWTGVPAGAKSLVLILDDPDAPDPASPRMTWVHWVLYNIPPDSTGLPEGVSRTGLPAGTLEGKNDWKRTRYGGPCPPVGRHRYFHKLYALDTTLPDLDTPTKTQLEQAMRGHIMAHSDLIGMYQH